MNLESFLHSLHWSTCKLSFIHDTAPTGAVEPGLCVMNGILFATYKALENQESHGGRHHFFFHPADPKWPKFFKRAGAQYTVELVCIGPSPEERLEEAINRLKSEAKPRHFSLVDSEKPKHESLKSLMAHTSLPDVSRGELCLEFKTPFTQDLDKWDTERKTFLSREDFWNSLSARLAKFANLSGESRSELEEAVRRATDRIRILPYYWRRADFRHSSKSRGSRGQTSRSFG